jgi:hypothetical protein
MQVVESKKTFVEGARPDGNGKYRRYHIDTEPAPDIESWPSRFQVKVNRPQLALFLLRELVHFRGDREVILNRPCMYGVFSGPVGGFAPRQDLCVGCLRCTTQYPEIVQIHHNPERQRLGDAYFTSGYVNAVVYEAEGGLIPVKGAGYRGPFGGDGWDGMWTDMSEIVRPTRDGIHGREFISTVIDVGARPSFLTFAPDGKPLAGQVHNFSLPLPTIFDTPPAALLDETLARILSQTAGEIGSLAVLPLSAVLEHNLSGEHLVPLVRPAELEGLEALPFAPRLVELEGWDPQAFEKLRSRFPQALIALRSPFVPPEKLLDCYRAGVRVFHLAADYHGRGAGGAFVHDLIRTAHGAFVEAGCRDEVTLLGSGGIIAAEHVPKAIIAGLDAVALDTPVLVALQARFEGACLNRDQCQATLPAALSIPWGVQRLKNLAAAWRDQLLEVLGAMGLREVRRLRGEVGRVMYQKDLEREAFAGIEGYRD